MPNASAVAEPTPEEIRDTHLYEEWGSRRPNTT